MHLRELGRRTSAIDRVASRLVIIAVMAWLFIAFGVTACQPITIPYLAAKAPLPSTPLTIRATRQQVIGLMLNSHTQWRTLQAKATSVIEDDRRTNTMHTDVREVQIEQYGKVRAQSGPVDQPLTYLWISDGNTIWAEDLIRNTFTQEVVPESVRSLETYGPAMPPPAGQAFVVRYPLDGIILSALAEYVFPHGLAQSFGRGELDIVGPEPVAGRDTVIVLWQVWKDGILSKKHKYWIDTQTGIILKGEVYAEIPSWDRWVTHTEVTSIAYDQPIPRETFTFEPAPGATQITPGPR